MSRPLNDVVTFSLLLIMSRLLNDVATFFLCKLMSRQLLIWQLMSRPLNDVATLISLQGDVATTSDSVLTSRPLLDVATSIFSFLKILCRDFYLVSRPPCLLFCIQFCRDLMWFFITVNASLQQILSSSCTSPAATSFS